MDDELLYPVSLRIRGRLAVVVGGGTVAMRKVGGLRAAGADVRVVAPDLTPALADLADRGVITVARKAFEPVDLDGAWFAFACTDRPEVNATVAAAAEDRRLWCVRADDGVASAAWTPAVGRADGVTVAVNAQREPRRSAALRDRFVELVHESVSESRDNEPGGVAIVGGGPGDPGLLTVRGKELLRAADVVITDRLAPHDVLDELPSGVEVIDAAKVPRAAGMRQERINEALVEHARAGRRVVRLKGGDPFVFGRGLEEVIACANADVPVEVVPGVTSAVAAAASAGVPVTHRGVTQGFTVVSGHVPPDDPRSQVDWAALAKCGTTLVLLMAVENLAAIVDSLRAAGMPADTPAACVVEGCTPRQRVVTAPLGEFVAAADAAEIANPAVVVIGDVAGFASTTGQERTSADRVLVLGGARSGKSATAERLLAGREQVAYVATGPAPAPDDAEWAERVRLHQERRPSGWTTVETLDLVSLLDAVDEPPLLVDGLATWLTAVLDECGAWRRDPDADRAVEERVDALVAAWRKTTRHVVAVSDEAGSGVVPGTYAGRRFRDELGRLNARIAAECQQVWLCTAGVPRRLR
ncbi:MAG: uroporphyrinogen-III C-methyltransferase [Streptosporangiales bacterium]|nr:uroporphyrinogen-III C-methyltransferase [Streptosporangiales bacterium]